ncbi:hypothetical protein MAHJHV54_47640 [Mycobacterium avium subsp. hominissuis]
MLLCTAALAAAVATGYTHWTRADRDFTDDSHKVVGEVTVGPGPVRVAGRDGRRQRGRRDRLHALDQGRP